MQTPKAEKAIKIEAAKVKTPKMPKTEVANGTNHFDDMVSLQGIASLQGGGRGGFRGARGRGVFRGARGGGGSRDRRVQGLGLSKKSCYVKFETALTTAAVKELIEKYSDCEEIDFGRNFIVDFDDEESALKFKESSTTMEIAGLKPIRSNFARVIPEKGPTIKTESQKVANKKSVLVKFSEQLNSAAVKQLVKKYGDCEELEFGWNFKVFFNDEESALKFKESATTMKFGGLQVASSEFALNRETIPEKRSLKKDDAPTTEEAPAKKKKVEKKESKEEEVEDEDDDDDDDEEEEEDDE